MGLADKLRNSSQSLIGRLKERTGRAVGNRRLKKKGRREQAGGDLKQAGEKAKDAFRD
ncbi:CsbD family protein [Streptomyces sp. NPDC006660]|uniref:CsbD family protein n=1 Tax=Streptomyces sp. NPDC006660 TaxID=3156901 RepID=UPI0033C534D4